MVKYICKFPGCGELIDKRGYCDKHQKKDDDSFFAGVKPQVSYHSLYQSKEWKVLRKKVLQRDGTQCRMCGGYGNIVDHIIPHDGNRDLFLDENNLQVLCSACHGKKTLEESKEKAKKRKH